MKILHTSDWHLGRRPVGGIGDYSKIRYEDYFAAADYIVQKGIEENVDIFIMAGDLFDRSSLLPDILFKTEQLLEKLKNHKIKTLLIEGNHDKIYNQEDSWINYLENKSLILTPKFKKEDEKYIFCPIQINGIKFYGIPYQGIIIDEVLTALSEQLNKNERNIVIVHTGIGGNGIVPGNTKKEIIDLFKNKVLYMAGGHLHSYSKYPEKEPYFFVPGCPEYWDLNEKNKKGYVIFDTSTRKHQFYDSKKRKVSTYKLDYPEETLEKINDIVVEKNEIIRLKIINRSNKTLDTDKIENTLKEKGALKCGIQITYGNSKESFDNEKLNIKDIEKSVIESWGNIFSKNSEKIVRYLQSLKNNIDENEQFIYESFDNLLDNILKGDSNEYK